MMVIYQTLATSCALYALIFFINVYPIFLVQWTVWFLLVVSLALFALEIKRRKESIFIRLGCLILFIGHFIAMNVDHAQTDPSWPFSNNHLSPCGKSSCSDVSGQTDVPYHPLGWFNRNTYQQYLKVTPLTCFMGNECRWADRTGEIPKSSNLDGYATNNPSDYPDPGSGIRDGLFAFSLLTESVPCPFVRLEIGSPGRGLAIRARCARYQICHQGYFPEFKCTNPMDRFCEDCSTYQYNSVKEWSCLFCTEISHPSLGQRRTVLSLLFIHLVIQVGFIIWIIGLSITNQLKKKKYVKKTGISNDGNI